MNRISFGVGSVWALGAGALLALACNGKISAGSNTPDVATVSSAEVSGPVTACLTGAAHPNVCCQAGSGQASSCIDYPSAPFHACDSANGWLTYPDPRSCCELDGSGNCAAPPPVPPPTTGVCAYACPPGQFPGPSGGVVSVGTAGGSGTGGVDVGPNCAGGTGSGSSETCAGGSGSGTSSPGYPGSGSGTSYTGSGSGTEVGSGSGTGYVGSGSGSGTETGSGSGSSYTGSGSGTFIGSGSGSGYPGYPPVYEGTSCCVGDPSGSLSCTFLGTPASAGCACACPANGPCPPCNCPPEPPPPPPPLTGCNPCPLGWQTPMGGATPDLCCQQDPNTGDIDCFSQAVAPPGISTGSGSGGSTPPSVGSGSGTSTPVACGPIACPANAPFNPATCSCGGQ